MSDNQPTTDLLLDAVDALTKPRQITTVQKDDDTDAWLNVHTETHPPLLELLIEGTGVTRGSPSSEIRIPIDADALELWAQVHDLVQLWCRQLDASFVRDDLMVSVRHWYLAHANAYRGRKISDITDKDVTRMVQGWVRMIENKFDPPEKREWMDPCPAYRVVRGVEGEEVGHRRCGARRIVVQGEERFAIQLNVTTMTAECVACKSSWSGSRGLSQLRYETNLYQIELDDREAARTAELERLALGDTPDSQKAADSATA